MIKSLPVIAVALGVVLLIVSVAWAFLFPMSSMWTTEKNDRMSELSVQAHKLGGELDAAQRRPSMHARSAADIEVEYKQVTGELTQLREEFEGKRDRPKTTASLLRWSGIAFVAAGAFIVFASRS